MVNSSKRIFITGMAGFIGYHIAQHLSERGDHVFGCDNFDPYYNPALKRHRAKHLKGKLYEVDICDQEAIEKLVDEHQITHFIHLAAQAGVRFSLTDPAQYQRVNMDGFFHVLEVLRKRPHIHLTFASSSSVYGLNNELPSKESHKTDSPSNFYGASKKANEIIAFSYHHNFNIRMAGMRFFTVYGPMGRPDMALFSFTNAIKQGKPIRLFNEGDMRRDFTYVDDIVQGCTKALDLSAPFEIFNLGNETSEELFTLVRLIEEGVGKKAIIELAPMQPGEVTDSRADIEKAKKLLGFAPKTSLEEGVKKFLAWHEENWPDILQLC